MSVIIVTACRSEFTPIATDQDPDSVLHIWWNRGYFPEETEAIQQIIDKWEKISGIKAELTSYAEKDLAKATQNAVQNGNTPDILYNYIADLTLYPRYAWENKLLDVSDIVEPLRKWYSPIALESAHYLNKTTQKRSYYAVPFGEQTTYIHYWKDMLADAGLSEKDIPFEWNAFWIFWEKAQNILRQKQGINFKSMGLDYSGSATDTFYNFEQFLEAHNIKLLDENGNLQIDNEKTREKIISVLAEYSNFYQKGFTPLQATSWGDPDNNTAFLSREVLMTLNPSLSIPSSQRDEPDLYFNKMSTVTWPKKPDRSLMIHLVSVKQAVIFAASDMKKEAKDFLAFFTQPHILETYLRSNKGRYVPPMPKLRQSPFWSNPKDTHVVVANRQLRQTRLFYQVLNPAYSEVQSQNVWGEVIQQMATEGVSAEQAADQAITQIKEIFKNWS
jgi:multiple sugar transport system substrate-binding protein